MTPDPISLPYWFWLAGGMAFDEVNKNMLRDGAGHSTAGFGMGAAKGMMAFVHIEKAAGTTLTRILRQSFGLHHCDVFYRKVLDAADVDSEVAFARRFHPALRSIAGHGLLPAGFAGSSVHLYTLLREPLSRCLSHYQFQVQRMGQTKCFADWIAQPRFRDFQVTKIAGLADLDRARAVLRERFFFVGLVEDFDRSVQALAALAPYPLNLDYTAQNVAQHNRQKSEILGDKAQRWLLEDANQLDLALYAWVRDELHPELLQRAAEAKPRRAPRWGGVRLASNLGWRNLVYRPAWRLFRQRR